MAGPGKPRTPLARGFRPPPTRRHGNPAPARQAEIIFMPWYQM